jgi:hypothetical protein
MNEIKAIETVYNGYRFRSRLEARWAVFFDELGIKYEYEKEGFELPSGRYLPDFWLPKQKYWVEIKPTRLAFDDISVRLCKELKELSGENVLILMGNIPLESKVKNIFNNINEDYITDNPLDMYLLFHDLEYEDDWNDNVAQWIECPICHNFSVVPHGFCEEIKCHPQDNYNLISEERIEIAYQEARRARFEFNEAQW